MGRPIDLFEGDAAVDLSFASPAALLTDRYEIGTHVSRSVAAFAPDLGNEVASRLGFDSEGVWTPRERVGGRGTGRAAGTRPKIIYLAGVEGTGHHGFAPLLWYPAVCDYGDGVLTWWRSLREVLWKTHPKDRRAKLRTLMNAMRVTDYPHVIIETASYPFGEEDRGRWAEGCADPAALERERRSRNPGNSVDLAEFVDLFREHGDVRVLALHRGLPAAAWSHKEWDPGLLAHARVLALFCDYLAGVLKGLDSSCWRWVSYEEVCDAHRRGNYSALAGVADFLGLSPDAFERAFRHFRPSTKNAAAEMSADVLAKIRALEREHGEHWLPAAFPEQQLVAHPAPRGPAAQAPAPAGAGVEGEADLRRNQKLERLFELLTPEQKLLWEEATRSQAENAAEDVITARWAALQEVLTEEQSFWLSQGLIYQQVVDSYIQSEVDPGQYHCMHFWLEGRGFGSEVNNLISALIYCKAHSLHCVIEDEFWNSGRLHDYFRIEPDILRECPRDGECHPGRNSRVRQLEIRRHKGTATDGWFAIGKHAMAVPFKVKAEFAQKLWRFTGRAERAVSELNHEMNLPASFLAIHMRRGDKIWQVNGRPGFEAMPKPIAEYARAASSYMASPSEVVVVCSDDASAAEEFEDALRRIQPRAVVRRRNRDNIPEELKRGHWQKEYNKQKAAVRTALTYEFLADVEVMRKARILLCTHSSNVGRLAALLREGRTLSLDEVWTNT